MLSQSAKYKLGQKHFLSQTHTIHTNKLETFYYVHIQIGLFILL